ncbi:MAG: hypothetical protein GY809_15810 [Planctomycetes bacterium]|nr:hypothetical protein [Planctomycetota bacterium]
MTRSSIKRREFLAGLAAGAAALTLPSLSHAEAAATSRRRSTASGIEDLVFRPLPLGSVTPTGWLQRQLRLQADGLTGHLDEFWPDVSQSQWFGGKAEGWERAPYWLDGVIPLAWVLNDKPLQAKCRRYVKQMIAGQRADGWYAPYPLDAATKPYDMWAILLVNKVLVQYHEATGEATVLEAVARNLKAMLPILDKTPLFGWGKFRWFEGLISVYYVYERTGEDWLLELARKLHTQGFDYRTLYAGHNVTLPTPRRGLWRLDKHVVNTGMALKAYALASRLTRREKDRAFGAEMLAILDQYHGQIHGMFTGDECLSGTNPVQGTELCAVVEAMYSLEHLIAVTGDPAFGDRLERIAFNALPATFAPNMWSHQYDQQANQVQCTINPDHMWSTNGPESNLYGLEPNYGCCTSNMHQGWPKLASHLWMRAGEGLAAVAYAPSSAQFETQGARVEVTCDTDYPFRDTLDLKVTTDKPVRFPLWLRVPAWSRGATLDLKGGPRMHLKPGIFHRIERDWHGTTRATLHLPMQAKTSQGYNGAVRLERGPLVYSLKLGEKWTRVNADTPHRELPHGDFEVRPTTPWNYGLLLDEENPDKSVTFKAASVGDTPFSPEGAGMTATVQGRRVPGWRMAHGWAAEVPADAQTSKEPLEALTLIPYGCTNIRVTEFPRLQR